MEKIIPVKYSFAMVALRKATLGLVFALCCLNGISQPITNDKISFNHFSFDHGLPQTTFTSIIQDNKGYLWFGAFNGLIKYDGYSFTTFRFDPDSKNSLPFNDIDNLCEDSSGNIWMIGDNSIGRYNKRTTKFTLYKNDKELRLSTNAGVGSCLATDKHGRLWIGTTTGLYFYDFATNSFVNLHYPGLADSLVKQNIKCLMLAQDGKLWIAGSKGIGIYDPVQNNLQVFNPVDKKYRAMGKEAVCIMQDHLENIWISFWNKGLYFYDSKTGISKTFKRLDNEFNSLTADMVNTLCEDSHHNIWAGTYTGGVSVYNPKNQSFRHYQTNLTDFHSLGSNQVKYIFKDRSGVLWIATAGGGLNNCYLPEKKINVYKPGDKALSSHFPLFMYKDKAGRIYISTFGEGVLEFDRLTGNFKCYKYPVKKGEITGLNFCYGMTEASDGHLWVVSFDEGLLTIDHSKGILIPIHSNFDNTDTTLHNQSNCVVEDQNKRLWVATEKGLKYYDLALKTFAGVESLYKNVHQLSNDELLSLYCDKDGILWIGGSKGLTALNTRTGQTKIFSHDDSKPFSISNDKIKCFYEDDKGILWVGTNGGLNRFDKNKEQFTAYTVKDGLPENSINGIIGDDCNLWLATNKGICLFTQVSANNRKSICRNYDISDGLPSDEFSYNTCVKGNDNTLYFATNEGLATIRVKDLKDNQFVPQVFITNFGVFNKAIMPGDSTHLLQYALDETKEIKLSSKQNNFSFSFSTSNYLHPEKNSFAYMLEGYDEDWIYTDATKRFASYTNLDPGEYIFKVKASNNDGVWNPVPHMITLMIAPPYWKTWWFRTLSGFILVLSLYLLYRYRLRQVIRLQTMRNNIASDLHDDIGSTLNSISVLSEVAKLQAGKSLQALDEIGESSRKIIESMSDIVWTINPENDDFEKIIERMRSFVYQILKGKKIEFKFQTIGEFSKLALSMQVRKNMYLIFKEAVTNIAKYSGATHVKIVMARYDAHVYLTITDNGVGFDINKADSGNGLKNMQRRAKETKGTLTIESTLGGGTNIQLILKA